MGQQALRYNDDALPPQIRALLELEHFLSSPKSVGLDSVKESLRNVVQLMLELKGYSTGYDLSHLVIGEHSSLAMEGVLKNDRIKKKKERQLWDDLMELEKEMARSFAHTFEHVHRFINNIEDKIDDQLAAIDSQIDSIAKNEVHATQLKQTSKKRKRLKLFKKHVKKHKEQLHEAESTEELIDLQQDLIEDLEDFNNGHLAQDKKHRTSGMSVFASLKDSIFSKAEYTPTRSAANAPFYNSAPIYDFNDHSDDLPSSSDYTEDKKGSGDKDDGKKDSGITPPELDI